MKIGDVQRLFQMPNWRGEVADYYVGTHDQFSPKRHAKDMWWNFAFKLKNGDVLCAVLLRPSKRSLK